jgi:lipopolysaccharide export system permease protein
MKIYLRYLLWQLALPTLFATLAFSGAVWLSQSLRFVDLIVNKGLPLTTFLYLTLLLFPSLLLVILPFALFCAVLFVYYRLIQESELIVMQAVGLSHLQLTLPGLALAGIITAIGYANSLYLMPAAFRDFRDLQYEIRRDFSHVLLQPGVFNTPVPDLTVYVRDHHEDGSLSGILVHDERNQTLPVTMMAEQGMLLQGENGPLFVLEHGNRQELDLSAGSRKNLSILHFERYTLDLAAAAAPPEERFRKPKELFLDELLNPDEPGISDARRRELLAEAHKRLTWPLNAAVFALIGITVLLTRRFDRRGPGRSILIAVLSAVGVQSLSMAAGSLAEQSLAVVPLLYLATIAPIGVCIALLMGYRPAWPARLAWPRPATAA